MSISSAKGLIPFLCHISLAQSDVFWKYTLANLNINVSYLTLDSCRTYCTIVVSVYLLYK